MKASGSKSFPPVGFLTVLERPEVGCIGGYLILNSAGRPLEFHCTSPVRPNRAQEILYGPTLRPFLFGEQIGHTLVTKSPLEPLFICTDVGDVLSLRDLVTFPVVLIVEEDGEAGPKVSESARDWKRIDGAHERTRDSTHRHRLGKREIILARGHEDETKLLDQHWATMAENLDLLEPFARIREAIEETQRGTK